MTTSRSWNRVTAGYFDVIGTSDRQRARHLRAGYGDGSRHVAVINEAFARKFFRNEDPIGKHFGRKAGASRQFEVVGVAKDARYSRTISTGLFGPFFFLPEAQAE